MLRAEVSDLAIMEAIGETKSSVLLEQRPSHLPPYSHRDWRVPLSSIVTAKVSANFETTQAKRGDVSC